MRSVYYLLLLAFLLASCSTTPPESLINTAVAQTLAAQFTSTNIVVLIIDSPEPTSTAKFIIPTSRPTNTPDLRPTNTKAPTRTSIPTTSLEQLRTDFSSTVADAITNIEDVETINMVRIANRKLEIELRTRWASQDRQPIVSYELIQLLATGTVNNISADKAAWFVESDKFSIYLVTYSTDGDFRYESTTDWDTLEKLDNQSISYDEWVTASNAGFR
jgi:hypothetical protein